jgi:hypothetical protein
MRHAQLVPAPVAGTGSDPIPSSRLAALPGAASQVALSPVEECTW